MATKRAKTKKGRSCRALEAAERGSLKALDRASEASQYACAGQHHAPSGKCATAQARHGKAFQAHVKARHAAATCRGRKRESEELLASRYNGLGDATRPPAEHRRAIVEAAKDMRENALQVRSYGQHKALLSRIVDNADVIEREVKMLDWHVSERAKAFQGLGDGYPERTRRSGAFVPLLAAGGVLGLVWWLRSQRGA